MKSNTVSKSLASLLKKPSQRGLKIVKVGTLQKTRFGNIDHFKVTLPRGPSDSVYLELANFKPTWSNFTENRAILVLERLPKNSVSCAPSSPSPSTPIGSQRTPPKPS